MICIKLLKASVDRLTAVGNCSDHRRLDLLGVNPFVVSQKVARFPYRYQWHMQDGSILQLSEKGAEVPDLRYECNPNHWESKSSLDRHVMEIFRLFSDIRFTRMDFAFDIIGVDFSRCMVIDSKVRQEAQYKGSDKAIETYYFGTRRSDQYIRLYNKGREQGVRSIYKDDDWWRLEAQINGEIGLDDNPFKDILVSRPGGIPEALGLTDKEKIILLGLKQAPNLIGAIGKNDRAKYKTWLLCSSEPLPVSLSELWEQKKDDLRQEVDLWKNLCMQ